VGTPAGLSTTSISSSSYSTRGASVAITACSWMCLFTLSVSPATSASPAARPCGRVTRPAAISPDQNAASAPRLACSIAVAGTPACRSFTTCVDVAS
jgi:hypothetical protein